MKRFKYFLVVFSVFALLLSFSAVDVKAGATPGPQFIDDCVIDECLADCHDDLAGCREFCRTNYPGAAGAQCVKYYCAIVEECCINECLWDICGIGALEDGYWCPFSG